MQLTPRILSTFCVVCVVGLTPEVSQLVDHSPAQAFGQVSDSLDLFDQGGLGGEPAEIAITATMTTQTPAADQIAVVSGDRRLTGKTRHHGAAVVSPRFFLDHCIQRGASIPQE